MKRSNPLSLAIAFAAFATLGGCFEDPYAKPLSELDLSNASVVADIASSLAPEDAGVFKTYALRHIAQTKYACGNFERHLHGKQPQTVAEAVDFTRQWEKEDAERRAYFAPPDPSKMTPDQRFEYELEQLRIVYRRLDDRRADIMMLNEEGGYEDTAEWKQIAIDMEAATARINEKLAQRP